MIQINFLSLQKYTPEFYTQYEHHHQQQQQQNHKITWPKSVILVTQEKRS